MKKGFGFFNEVGNNNLELEYSNLEEKSILEVSGISITKDFTVTKKIHNQDFLKDGRDKYMNNINCQHFKTSSIYKNLCEEFMLNMYEHNLRKHNRLVEVTLGKKTKHITKDTVVYIIKGGYGLDFISARTTKIVNSDKLEPTIKRVIEQRYKNIEME